MENHFSYLDEDLVPHHEYFTQELYSETVRREMIIVNNSVDPIKKKSNLFI